VHRSWNCARPVRARSRSGFGRHGHHRERSAGRLDSDRAVSVLHDVSDHGEDRLSRGRQSRQGGAAGRTYAIRQLGRQALHDVRDRELLSRHAVSEIHRAGRRGSGQDAAGQGPGRRRRLWRGAGCSGRWRQDARSTALAKLSCRLHPARDRTVYRDGARLGVSLEGQRRPHAGHGCDQLADDVAAVRISRRIPVGSRPAAGALAGVVAIHWYLRRTAAGLRLRVRRC